MDISLERLIEEVNSVLSCIQNKENLKRNGFENAGERIFIELSESGYFIFGNDSPNQDHTMKSPTQSKSKRQESEEDEEVLIIDKNSKQA